MDLKHFIKPLGYMSASLAIVQGLIWTILSILTLLIHFDVWKISLTLKTHKDLLNSALLLGYVLREEGFSTIGDVFIKPKQFYIWAIVFLFISVFWTVLSVYFFIVLIKNQTHNFKKIMLAWGIWTSVVCIIDVLLTGLLANDYSVLVSAYNAEMTMNKLYALLSCGVLMTISAKGFLMWFINITLTIVILTIYSKLPKTFEPLENHYSTNSLSYLRYPSEEDGRIKGVNTEHELGTFQGLPRVPPVQTTNQDVIVKLPSNLKNAESHHFPYHPRQMENSDYYAKPTLQLYRKHN